MNKFTLSTDSTSDLYRDYVDANDIKFVSLTYTIEDNGTLTDHLDNFTEVSQYKAFFADLANGAFSRTSMLNYETHYNHFLKMAEEGATDVLHFTISSGLSPTKDVAAKAAAEVKKQYPDFNVLVVDPLAATIGQGSLVRLGLKCRNEGMTVQEAYDYVMNRRMHQQVIFMADDLKYLKRGGRVSSVAAAVGGVLQIKPILMFDRNGKLTVVEKARGPKKAISIMKNKIVSTGVIEDEKMFCIVHTENEPMANELADFVRETFGVEPECIQYMGPTIGSHVGPGAFGICWFSPEERA